MREEATECNTTRTSTVPYPTQLQQRTESALCSRVLFDYAKGDPGRRSLVEIIESGRVAAADEEAVFVNANHVLESLCVRLARTANAFKVLPDLLQQNEAIQTLSAALLEPVEVLHAFVTEHGAIDTAEKHTAFVALIRDLSRRGKILGDGEALSQLRIAVGRARSLVTVDPSFFDHFASSLLLHSVSCVVSIQHHLLLSDSNRGAHHVGAFDTQMRPVAVLRDCAFKTQTVCGHQLGMSPHIDVKGDLTATLTYIEPHFRYMMTEILKNAAHATVKNHSLESGVIDKTVALPAVTVLVESCEETQAVTVTVTDAGGGMDRSVFANIWRFGYTTAHDASGLHGDEAKSGSGLNGWGFGLPRSLVYARYLGGDIQIENTPGQGCTVRMTLPTATSPQAMECLSFSEAHLSAKADEVVQS